MPCYKCGNTEDGTKDTACQKCCATLYTSLQKRSFQFILQRMKTQPNANAEDQLVQLTKEALW